MRAIVVAVIAVTAVASSTAHAQPEAAPPPVMPTEDPYAESHPTAAPWSPVDDEGWPRGVSLEQMRSLRPCGAGEVLPGPGAVIPCRPPLRPEPVQWQLGFDWTTGIVFGSERPVTGGAQALGVQLDFGLSRRLQLGVRYELMGIGLPDVAPDQLNIGVSHRFFAQLRHRFFTDEVDRDAFAISLGGGYAIQEDELGSHAPIARVAIAREVGAYLDDENSVGAMLELAYQQTFGDAPLSAVLASARWGFELNIREPGNLGTVDEPPPARYWAAGDVYLGPTLGLGYTVGLALSRNLQLVSTASFLFGRTDVTRQHGLEGSQWAAQSGPRLITGWPAWGPIYAQLQGGAMWTSRDAGRDLTTVADAELGFQPFLGCAGGLNFGLRLRAEVVDGVDLLSGMFVFRIAMGRGAHHGRNVTCSYGESQPTMPTEPPPPPVVVPIDPVVVTPPDGEITVEGGGDVTVEGGGEVEVSAEPVVIEVELGAVLFGGYLEVRLDPRLLPLDKLRAGGLVEVELSGPADALVEYEASLRGLLDSEGVGVHAWARVKTAGSVVRARFTIWPPGIRPR